MAFQNPVIAREDLIVPGVRSRNYELGIAGWRLGRDGNAQVDSLQAISTVGATIVTANEDLIVADNSLTDMLAQRPVGMLAYDQIVSATPTGNISTPETVMYRMSFGPATTTSFYLISFTCFLVRTVPGDAFQIRIRYASGSTMPTITSPTMPGALVRIPGGVTGSFTVFFTFPFASPVDSDRINMAFTLERIAGTGTASITSNTSDTGFTWFVMDGGLRADVGGVISQVSKSAGVPDPDPVTTYTRRYYATWSRTYDQDNSTTWDDSDYCYQGRYSDDRGDTKSLVGFDYSQIMSDLSGSTIVSCYLTFKCAHSYYNSGLTARIGTHDYTAKPSTWDFSRADEWRHSVTDVTAGETITKSLGTGIGGEFRSGTSKGICFGPGGSTDKIYYGYFYGGTQVGQPYLTIKFKK
jgi:hypothetical protein